MPSTDVGKEPEEPAIEKDVCKCLITGDFVEEQDPRSFQGDYYLAGAYCGIVESEHATPDEMTEEERTAAGGKNNGCGGELKLRYRKMQFPRVCACKIKRMEYGIAFCCECYVTKINTDSGGRRTRTTRKK